jgi:divalent metal cation (Fe/Co/Zn/Cd) transporter
MIDRGGYLESIDEIPEPHAFTALVSLNQGAEAQSLAFEEHEDAHGAAHRDNNMRAAIVHVLADAAVSVLVIVGLLLRRFLGWDWMDPVAGTCGAVVIAALRARAGHRRHPARHEPRPRDGGARAGDNRG